MFSACTNDQQLLSYCQHSRPRHVIVSETIASSTVATVQMTPHLSVLVERCCCVAMAWCSPHSLLPPAVSASALSCLLPAHLWPRKGPPRCAWDTNCSARFRYEVPTFLSRSNWDHTSPKHKAYSTNENCATCATCAYSNPPGVVSEMLQQSLSRQPPSGRLHGGRGAEPPGVPFPARRRRLLPQAPQRCCCICVVHPGGFCHQVSLHACTLHASDQQ